jgi:hypothetical protein
MIDEKELEAVAKTLAEAFEFLASGIAIQPHSKLAWDLVNAYKMTRQLVKSPMEHKPLDSSRNLPPKPTCQHKWLDSPTNNKITCQLCGVYSTYED